MIHVQEMFMNFNKSFTLENDQCICLRVFLSFKKYVLMCVILHFEKPHTRWCFYAQKKRTIHHLCTCNDLSFSANYKSHILAPPPSKEQKVAKSNTRRFLLLPIPLPYPTKHSKVHLPIQIYSTP